MVILPHEQDYAFFASIEKVEDQHLLICSSFGEILGAATTFSKVLAIDPQLLQETQPSLQIFMPYTFEYFLQYFFPENAKLKRIKNSDEVRREGYFPEGLDIVMK